MAKKVRLTPLQRDILWMLEEAGEETVATMLATLKPTDQQVYERDLEGLVRLGFVEHSEHWGHAVIVLTDAGGRALTT